MKATVLALLVATLLFAPTLARSASAEGPSDPQTDDDLGIQLADMFATMADVLAARQDQIANESHLGSASASRRLRSAVSHVPPVFVRGASPFVEGWIIGED